MNSTRLIYVTDPLCLWCYGISSIVEEFYQGLPLSLVTETINGGLFIAEHAKHCDKNFRDYLKQAAKQVTKLSGKKFGTKFWELLEKPGFMYNTEPSAKASVTVKHLAGDKAMLSFMHAIQLAFFVEGKNVMQAKVLASIAGEFGVKSRDFLEFYLSEQCANLTKQEYAETKQLGIQGFPALLYLKGRQGYKLSVGFSTLENLNNAFTWAVSECKQTKSNNLGVCSAGACST